MDRIAKHNFLAFSDWYDNVHINYAVHQAKSLTRLNAKTKLLIKAV